MSTDQILASVDPRKMAQANRTLEGSVPLCSLPRIVDAVTEQSVACSVDLYLEFRRSTEGLFQIIGHLKTQVDMLCQRCLKPVNVPLDVQVNVVLAWHDEQAKSLNGDWDTVVVAQDLSIKALIEDELLLNFPLAPCHESAQCLPHHNVEPMETADKAQKTRNPFGVLVHLKAGKSENPEKS